MTTTRWIAAGAVLLGATFGVGCGDSSGADGRATAAARLIDTGLLSDQTAYQPAGGGSGGGSGDAESQVRDRIAGLIAALDEGDVIPVVQAFGGRAEELEEVLVNQRSVQELLERVLADTFGEIAVERIRSAPIQDFRTQQSVEVVDADRVDVTPNLFGRFVLGSRAPEVMTFVQEDGEWIIQLDELSPDDIEQISEYHKNLNDGMNTIAEAVEDQEIETMLGVLWVWDQISAGEAPDIDQADAAAAAGAKKDGADEDEPDEPRDIRQPIQP